MGGTEKKKKKKGRSKEKRLVPLKNAEKLLQKKRESGTQGSGRTMISREGEGGNCLLFFPKNENETIKKKEPDTSGPMAKNTGGPQLKKSCEGFYRGARLSYRDTAGEGERPFTLERRNQRSSASSAMRTAKKGA